MNDAFKRMREELESEKSQTSSAGRGARSSSTASMALLGIGGEIQGLAHQELPQLELEPPPGAD